MSDNIRTMKRVRRAHARLATLADEANAADAGADEPFVLPPLPHPSAGAGLGGAPDTDATDTVDDTPWRPRGMEGRKRTRHVHGAEADDCLRWMTGRVVEHAGFQGSSMIALDVLGSVVGEYLGNVGRTMRFLEDKYRGIMTPEVRASEFLKSKRQRG
jgi:transcriptional activator SPT7